MAAICIFKMAAIIKYIVDFTGRLSMGMSKATALKDNIYMQGQLISFGTTYQKQNGS